MSLVDYGFYSDEEADGDNSDPSSVPPNSLTDSSSSSSSSNSSSSSSGAAASSSSCAVDNQQQQHPPDSSPGNAENSLSEWESTNTSLNSTAASAAASAAAAPGSLSSSAAATAASRAAEYTLQTTPSSPAGRSSKGRDTPTVAGGAAPATAAAASLSDSSKGAFRSSSPADTLQQREADNETDATDSEAAAEGDAEVASFVERLPKGPPPPELLATITRLQNLKRRGITVNANINTSLDFKNPYLLEKIMKLFGINPYSSNFPPGSAEAAVGPPFEVEGEKETPFYLYVAKRQDRRRQRREKQREVKDSYAAAAAAAAPAAVPSASAYSKTHAAAAASSAAAAAASSSAAAAAAAAAQLSAAVNQAATRSKR